MLQDKKRIFAIIATLVFVLAFSVGCGEDGEKETQNDEVLNENATLEERVTAAVIKAAGNNANTENRERIRELKINELEEGSVVVLAHLNADDSFSMKKSIYMKTRDIMKEIYTQPEVAEAVLFWYFPLVDAYGNKEDGVVMKIGYTKETADKANWDNVLTENVPKIADTYFEHPALND